MYLLGWFGFNAANTLAEVLRRSPTLLLAASAILGQPAHVEMVSALVTMPGAVEGQLTRPSGPGADHRVIIDIPLLPRPQQSDIKVHSREQGEGWSNSDTADYDAYDEPSIAICLGNLHSALWQPEELPSPLHGATRDGNQQSVEGLGSKMELATGNGANGHSCAAERRIDNNRCEVPLMSADIKGNDKGYRNVKEKACSSTNILQSGLATSGCNDGDGGVQGTETDATLENAQTGKSYSQKTTLEQACTSSVESS